MVSPSRAICKSRRVDIRPAPVESPPALPNNRRSAEVPGNGAFSENLDERQF
jgi:hypothetical protein